ncbi:MAG: MerR family transcriptional regulator [Anaerolineae bacterium]|nr:MerR family transcriptional regulator [Anaerolineae bacterium]
MYYTSRHVRILFNIAAETVRNWCDEFERHLSPTANPGKGKHRNFTEDDMRVFALIAELKNQGLSYDEVHLALDNGQRGDPPQLPADEMRDLVATEEKQQITLEMEVLQRSLTMLVQERDELKTRLTQLEGEVQPVKDDNIRLTTRLEESQRQAEKLAADLEQTRRRLEELNREVGRAYHEGYMDALNSPSKNDDE